MPPEDERSLLERIKSARAAQVGVLYLGGSWAALQLVDTLMDMLGLPEWLGPVTVVLLSVGLVVVVATAWVQSLESTTRAEQAGEVPTDWEVDPADAIASLKAGRLPHLTWGRAALGGVVAFSLALGAAGTFVLMGGGPSLIGPPSAGVEEAEAAEAIAVLPFEADGADIEFMREGMVRLVSASFDGVGDFRTIDSRTVLARWDEEVSEGSRPDLESTLRVARRTGARYAVLGSVVPAGQQLRVNAALYDVRDGSNVGDVQSEGAAEDVLGLVDRLTVDLATELMGASGATTRTLASITTASPEALKAYLEGEGLYRRGELGGAAERLADAVAIDSTFALAWMRLNEAAKWLGQDERGDAALVQARRFRKQLSPRRDELLTALSDAPTARIPLLQQYLRRYPDDAEAWNLLGDDFALDWSLDQNLAPELSTEAMVEALERAVELDPGVAQYRYHIVDLAFLNGDSLAAQQAIAAYWENGGERNRISATWEWGFRLLFGPESDVATAAVEGFEASGLRLLGPLALRPGADLQSRDLAFRRVAAERTPVPLAHFLIGAGRLDEWQALLMEQVDRSGLVEMSTFLALRQFGVELDPDPRHMDVPIECDERVACMHMTVDLLLHGTVDGHQREYDDAVDAWDRRVDDQLRPTLNDPTAPLESAALWLLFERFRAWGELANNEPEAALDRWQNSGAGPALGRIFGMGIAYEVLGDLARAEHHYRFAVYGFWRPYATYRLAQLYERMGRTSEAHAEYRRLETRWADADEDFSPWVETRAALTRLGG